jgi:hypothetical protein
MLVSELLFSGLKWRKAACAKTKYECRNDVHKTLIPVLWPWQIRLSLGGWRNTTVCIEERIPFVLNKMCTQSWVHPPFFMKKINSHTCSTWRTHSKFGLTPPFLSMSMRESVRRGVFQHSLKFDQRPIRQTVSSKKRQAAEPVPAMLYGVSRRFLQNLWNVLHAYSKLMLNTCGVHNLCFKRRHTWLFQCILRKMHWKQGSIMESGQFLHFSSFFFYFSFCIRLGWGLLRTRSSHALLALPWLRPAHW